MYVCVCVGGWQTTQMLPEQQRGEQGHVLGVGLSSGWESSWLQNLRMVSGGKSLGGQEWDVSTVMCGNPEAGLGSMMTPGLPSGRASGICGMNVDCPGVPANPFPTK